MHVLERNEFRLRFHWTLFLKVQISNIPALVQIMAWCWPGDKPLSEPLMVSLLTCICITRPQWVNNDNLWCCYWWSNWQHDNSHLQYMNWLGLPNNKRTLVTILSNINPFIWLWPDKTSLTFFHQFLHICMHKYYNVPISKFEKSVDKMLNKMWTT